jgi:multimeric flavodoxin WrbA
MKVLALIGSPRKQGNTDIMADEALRGAQDAGAEASKIYLDDYRIRPIGEVSDNSRQRDDARKDDDFPSLLDRFLDAHIVVWATPVYWQGPSGQLKCFLDRMSAYFRRPAYAERFDGKCHVVLCAFGCEEPDHGKWVTEPMKVTVEVLRGRYLGEVCVSVYEKGKVKTRPEVLRACYELGKKAVQQMREEPRGGHAQGSDSDKPQAACTADLDHMARS